MKVKQSIAKELRYSVRDFDNEFPHDSACLEYIKEQRWPNGVTWCVKCLADRKHHRVGNRTAYACQSCGHHIYPLAGTIFEKSTTSLKTWFYAMYLMGSTRCGISAKQIQRETGVTYKTAWRMFKQIRQLLSEDGLQLEGSTVEMDEMFHGGSRRTSSWRDNKVPVVGMVERGGRVVARVAQNVKKETLHGLVKQYVMPSSIVFTDDFVSYDGLQNLGYTHRRIRHSEKVYVSGDVHTNTIRRLLEHCEAWNRRGLSQREREVLADLLERILLPVQQTPSREFAV